MFLTRSEYDRGINTFSPEGRLFQVEYAIEAIKQGSTALAIATPHGIVLAVEKRSTSVLLENSSIEKCVEIDSHLGCAMSGLIADSRTMIDHARVEAQVSSFLYLLSSLLSSIFYLSIYLSIYSIFYLTLCFFIIILLESLVCL